jgi:hypothetical protein
MVSKQSAARLVTMQTSWLTDLLILASVAKSDMQSQFALSFFERKVKQLI